MRRTAGLFLAVAAAYAAGSQLAFSWFGADGLGASFFPAAGVTMAALLMVERRRWPVVLVAAGLAELAIDLYHDIPLAPTLGYVAANLIQPLVGATVLALVAPRLDLGRMRDLVAFLGIAVVGAPAVGGAIGATTFVVLDDGSGWARFAAEWWVGDGLGVLVTAATILSVRRAPGARAGLRRGAEAAVLAGASGLTTAAVLHRGWFVLIYVPIILLLVAGFRTGTGGAAITGAVTAFVAAQATAGGHTWWRSLDLSPEAGLLHLQVALAVLIASALAIAAAVAERERAAVGRELAERFRQRADAAPAMLWITDRAGRCTYISRSWCEHTGQSEEEGLGEGWLAAVHPEDQAVAREALARAAERREPFAFDVRLRTAAGDHGWAIHSGRPLLGPDGEWLGFIGSVIDIHDRTRIGRALHESDEARFRTLFEAIDEAFCLAEIVTDDDGRPIDYRFLDVNDAFEAMTGLTDVRGRRVRDLVPEVEQEWVDFYARVALDGEQARFTYRSERIDRDFDVFASPVPPRGRFALVFRDITEQLREEAAERRARERAELLNDATRRLETAEGAQARAALLVDLLVPVLADAAAVEAPDGSVVARAPRDGAGAREPDGDAVAAALGAAGWSLRVLRSPSRPPFTAEERALLRDLGEQAGLLLARARIRDRERRVALHLQRALLPGPMDPHPAVRISARYAAAGDALEVGGDWYEAFPLADGRVGIVAGDVVGHGIEAAATMGRLRTALAALAAHAGGPGELLQHLSAFADGPNGTDFATVAYAILDPATGELVHASAGHPPMLVVDADGATRWLEEGRSAPLCRVPVPVRPEGRTLLGPGATLILFTDGLVERRGRPLKEGFDALAAVAAEDPRLGVNGLCARIVGRMLASGNEDDAVVLCVRFAPVPGGPFRGAFPARPEELRRLRAAVGAWLEGRDVPAADRRRLMLAVGEAATNAVRHAYAPGERGEVVVEIDDADGGGLLVRVRDAGRWSPPGEDAGYGTGIMTAVGERFARESDAGGTTVSFVVRAGRATPA